MARTCAPERIEWQLEVAPAQSQPTLCDESKMSDTNAVKWLRRQDVRFEVLEYEFSEIGAEHAAAAVGRPLETADLIGLDTILNSIEVLAESVNGEKYKPCLLLEDMVQSGLLGQKSGKGFYDYPV